MSGYLLVPHGKVDAKYNAGFSMYVAAWPLLKDYPGQQFQSGLFGTWMFSQSEGRKPKDLYSDIEGGLGWWRDTRFATETPKFIMGGVALNFVEWANGPGAGKGRDWKKPAGHYAIAQLSPWVLWPPDGLNLKQGTSGELFGYGYLPLPLTSTKKTTAGKDVPTGNHCWTLFLNTGNFKGPVTFFLPYFWSRPSVEDPKLGGLFLDARPSEPNKAVQMETQHIPAFIASDAKGETYARIAPTLFPGKPDGAAPLVHRITAYSKAALWDGVQAWFDGGKAVSGEIDPKPASVHAFESKGGATWQIDPLNTPRAEKVPVAWSSFATPVALDESTYGYRWNKALVTNPGAKHGSPVTLPEYYRLEKDKKGKARWVVMNPKDVPAETGLAKVEFARPRQTPREPYVTPDEAESSLEEARPRGGAVRGETGRRQCRDLLLVSLRRPARFAECRSGCRGTGEPPEAGRDAAQALDQGARISSPAASRQARRPRPGGPRDTAEGPGDRLRADRHATGRDGVGVRDAHGEVRPGGRPERKSPESPVCVARSGLSP